MSARIERIFGDLCKVNQPSGSGRLTEVSVSAATFEKLLKHWQDLPVTDRPGLRGLSAARSTSQLQVVLDPGAGEAFLLLTVDSEKGKTLPGLATIWPYAQWWEEELRAFGGMKFTGLPAHSEVEWRRN
ncbi:MAG TPA: hypothetical protein VIH99_11220 [Bdellovibrionota bacterium]|jgi:Ni,Fe-hydrogenase III component G